MGNMTAGPSPSETARDGYRAMERSVFDWNGCRVVLHRAGSGSPILFLHNGGNDHRIWDYQLARFSRSHAVIAVDLPGYGDSDRPRTSYTLSFYVDFVRDCIDHLSLERPVLVGNCVGSAMAVRYALSCPDRVAGLVLCNVLTERTLSAGVFGPLYRAIVRHPMVRRLVARWTGNAAVRRIAREISPSMQYGESGDPDPAFIGHLRARYAHPEHLRVLYDLLCNIPDFAQLDRMAKPAGFPKTCVIWGEQNRVLPWSAGREWCERFVPERMVVLPKSGHLIMRELYDQVNECIDGFLSELQAAQG